MTMIADHCGQDGDAVLVLEVSDEALEAAADTERCPAFSLPNAPTVSILVACCGNNVGAPWEGK